MMKISINANCCELSPIRKFHPLAVAAEQRGLRIFHLNIGQPDLPTPSAFYDAIRQVPNDGTVAYAPSPGMPKLISAVERYYRGNRGGPVPGGYPHHHRRQRGSAVYLPVHSGPWF